MSFFSGLRYRRLRPAVYRPAAGAGAWLAISRPYRRQLVLVTLLILVIAGAGAAYPVLVSRGGGCPERWACQHALIFCAGAGRVPGWSGDLGRKLGPPPAGGARVGDIVLTLRTRRLPSCRRPRPVILR